MLQPCPRADQVCSAEVHLRTSPTPSFEPPLKRHRASRPISTRSDSVHRQGQAQRKLARDAYKVARQHLMATLRTRRSEAGCSNDGKTVNSNELRAYIQGNWKESRKLWANYHRAYNLFHFGLCPCLRSRRLCPCLHNGWLRPWWRIQWLRLAWSSHPTEFVRRLCKPGDGIHRRRNRV